MKPGTKNSYKSLSDISVEGKNYKYYSLKEAEQNGLTGISKLPKSLKVLLENLLRYEDDLSVNKNQINSIKEWLKSKKSNTEIAYRPARVLLQDYTGIPAVADLAAMREAVKESAMWYLIVGIEIVRGATEPCNGLYVSLLCFSLFECAKSSMQSVRKEMAAFNCF